MTITIARAGRGDADRLTALMLDSAAYQGRYASILAGYRIEADYIERNLVFTATAHGLVGFYALLLDPPELDLLFVADGAQGRGVGAALVAHMSQQARVAGLAWVRVVAHPPAERFYRRLGAEPVGTVAPRPPRVTWERPELRFVLSRAGLGERPAGRTNPAGR